MAVHLIPHCHSRVMYCFLYIVCRFYAADVRLQMLHMLLAAFACNCTQNAACTHTRTAHTHIECITIYAYIYHINARVAALFQIALSQFDCCGAVMAIVTYTQTAYAMCTCVDFIHQPTLDARTHRTIVWTMCAIWREHLCVVVHHF